EEHLLYVEALGSAAVVELEPVAQRWGHREPHVVQTHVESPIEERPRLRSEHDRLSAPRADPEPDVLAHGSRVGRLRWQRRSHEARDRSADVAGDRDLPDAL